MFKGVSCKGEEMPAQTDEFNLYVLSKCDHQCSVNVHAKMCNMSLLMFC